MVADAKNKLVSARKYAQMVLIEPEVVRDAAEERDVLALNAPGMDEVRVKLPSKEEMRGMQEEKLEVGHPINQTLGLQIA